MNQDWLKMVEDKLEEKFSEFIHSNPYQEDIFVGQLEKDLFHDLENKKIDTLAKANKVRAKIIHKSQSIKEWKIRLEKAKSVGSNELVEKASKQVNKLMKDGRELWNYLDDLGLEFRQAESELRRLTKHNAQKTPKSEDEWIKFETEQELEHMRTKKQGPK